MAAIFDKLRFGYSSDLHQHLKGLDLNCEAYSAGNFYSLLYPCVIVGCLVIMWNYYYGFFNRPKFANLFAWLLNVVLAGIIFFCVAFFKSSNDLKDHAYCESLHFTNMDCTMFGIVAAFYSVLLCVLYSLMIKWWSTNNKLIPFKLM